MLYYSAEARLITAHKGYGEPGTCRGKAEPCVSCLKCVWLCKVVHTLLRLELTWQYLLIELGLSQTKVFFVLLASLAARMIM